MYWISSFHAGIPVLQEPREHKVLQALPDLPAHRDRLAPQDHRGQPVLPDRLALQGPQEPPALREPRALQGPPVLRGPLVLPGLLAQLEKHKL